MLLNADIHEISLQTKGYRGFPNGSFISTAAEVGVE
jgi:hypothetical protein